jgi:hypothetical protein
MKTNFLCGCALPHTNGQSLLLSCPSVFTFATILLNFQPKKGGNMPAPKHTDDALMNHLLAALLAGEFARLQTALEPVSLLLGEVIYESGEQLEYLYFPTTAIISLLYIMENGSTAEIGMAGNDTRLIQDYLGHKNINHTVRYTRTAASRFEGLWR